MATYAKILTDSSGNQILPYTRAKLVYMEDNTTVENAIAIQASTSVYGRVKVGSNITVSSGVISVAKANVTSALGFTPVSTDAAKFLYHCNLPVASWASASSNTTYTGFSYSQTVTFVADNGGPTILSDKKLGAPMSTKTNSATTNETLQANLNIIAAGLMVCTSTTASEIMVFVKEKPSSDITIYFEAQS